GPSDPLGTHSNSLSEFLIQDPFVHLIDPGDPASPHVNLPLAFLLITYPPYLNSILIGLPELPFFSGASDPSPIQTISEPLFSHLPFFHSPLVGSLLSSHTNLLPTF